MSTRALIAMAAAVLVAACQSSGRSERDDIDHAKLAEVNTELGIQYMQKGEYEIALQKLGKALEADSNYVDAHHTLGVLYGTLGKDAEAERSFERALRLDPEDSAARNNYGQFLCLRGRHEEGLRQFLTAVDNPLYKQPAAAYSNAGTCALASGDLDTAEDHFRRALELDPRLAPALLQMAELSYELERHLPARAYLQRYLAVARPTARTLWLGIRIERELGDRDALASYSLMLEKSFPDAPETKLLLESR